MRLEEVSITDPLHRAGGRQTEHCMRAMMRFTRELEVCTRALASVADT